MNCDRIAPWYRWLEYSAFGSALQNRRREYLDEVAGARRVLILGDGDGRFTAEFLHRNRLASAESIDSSAGMLHLARKRVRRSAGNEERVRFHQGDARTVELHGRYDLIVTHFFLDCFRPDELEQLTARMAAVTSPGALWLVSEFHVPASGIRRLAARLLTGAMYLFFRATTGLTTSSLPDYSKILAANEFFRVKQRSVWGGFLVSELWERRPPA